MLIKKDIIKAIQTYIYRESVQYAIMIDGPWGIGKTHFIQNVVIPASRQVEFLYLSLYGISSQEKIESLVQSKVRSRLSVVDREQNFKALQQVAGAGIEDSVVLMRDKHKADASHNYHPVVLLLDDLERWSGDLNECLSYVNRLVEHDNMKCILIGNIDEISKESIQDFSNARQKTIRHIYHFENNCNAIFDIALTLPNYCSKSSKSFLRSLIKNNQPALRRLLDKVSVKNIRTIAEALQLFETVFHHNARRFKKNRNLSFAYLMALLSVLILVNKYLLTKNQREQFLNQDHSSGKGFKYLSEIGYFDQDSSALLTEQSRYLLDTIFYRLDQISLQGLFSLVRNGYYIKSDFVGDFDNWVKEQSYDCFLDKETFYQFDDTRAQEVFEQTYADLMEGQKITNPVTFLLLVERVIEDIEAGVVALDLMQFKASVTETVDNLYHSQVMQPVKFSIVDLTRERLYNCRDIYDYVLNRNLEYMAKIDEKMVASFWHEIREGAKSLESLMGQYDPAAVFMHFNRLEVMLDGLDALSNDHLYQLINWAETGINDFPEGPIKLDQSAITVQLLVEKITSRYGNQIGVRASQFRRLGRTLNSYLLEGDFKV